MYVNLPEEDVDTGMRGALRKATHGARHAAQNGENEHTEPSTEAVCAQGSFSASAFYREQKNVRAVARGDDVTALRGAKSLD